MPSRTRRKWYTSGLPSADARPISAVSVITIASGYGWQAPIQPLRKARRPVRDIGCDGLVVRRVLRRLSRVERLVGVVVGFVVVPGMMLLLLATREHARQVQRRWRDRGEGESVAQAQPGAVAQDQRDLLVDHAAQRCVQE